MCSDNWDFEANSDDWHTLNGGLGQIPDALSQKIKGPINLNSKITKIEYLGDNKGVQLTIFNPTNQQTSTKVFTSVICTTPAHDLRFIEMSPAFSYEKFQAIRKLNYDHATKVFLQYESRFWDKPVPTQQASDLPVQSTIGSNIVGGASSTDLPVFRVVYPSYGSSPDLCVLLASYTWTNDAVLMANLSDVERIQLIQQNLKTLHGDSVPDPVAHKSKLWQQAYALFFAGQYAEDYAYMVQPENGVYFAGEHLSVHHAWIVGAMYSAADAVGLWFQQHVGTVPENITFWANESPWFDSPSDTVHG